MASVVVRDAEAPEALAFLADLEAATGVPAVDEDEQRRLGGRTPVRDAGWAWAGHLLELDGAPVAYAGVRTPPAGTTTVARVDLAIDARRSGAHAALTAALDHLRSHAHAAGGTTGVEAWLRGATDADLATAATAGFVEHRRLHVLGADAATLRAAAGAPPAVPADLRIRPFDPDAPDDEAAVVGLLARVYPEGAERHGSGFAARRQDHWFRPDDLLLAEADDGRVLAMHWMKRRGAGVGEVHNLAVDPDAQGRRLGPLLLDLGVAHLLDVGCTDVILWVDAANPRAIALYRSRGFAHRWDDVSLVG